MQQQQVIPLRGGLDLETPALQLPPGNLIACENYESAYEGYQRVDGYERYDGQPKPSDADPYSLAFDGGSSEPNVGDKIEGATSGAFGFLLEAITLDSGTWGGGNAVGSMILRNVSGTFVDDENLQVSAANKAVANGTAQTPVGDTDAEQTSYIAAARDAARAEIAAVPGSGSVRGVVTYMGNIYAFRDNAGATACVMHKATTTGWSAQSFGDTIDFSAGTAAFLEGETVTGGTSSATATIERVVVTSGDWGSNDAAGYLVLSGTSGTFSASETITSASGSATAAGAQAAITLPAGGKYRFAVHNFYGASNLVRVYGVNGVGYAFEWDGTVLAPIRTSVATALDKPKFVAVQRNHLFLGYAGGYLLISGIGNPLTYSTTDGAGELSLGQELTGVYPSTKDSLIVTGRNKIAYVTGNDATDFVLNELSEASGAVADTLQVVGQPMFLDDQGVREMQAAESYGDWTIGTLTRKVQKIIRGNRKNNITAVGSIRVREKDQYRLFYSDKSGLSIYFGRGDPEITRFSLEFTPTCFHSGENASGDEILFAGDTNGFVYQLDSGTSADGAQITAFVRLAFAHQGAPNQVKRYHGARVETEGGSGPVSLGVVSNVSYGDPDHPASDEKSYQFAGGGGFWDEMFWDDFYWSTAIQSAIRIDLDSIGNNISITLLSDLTEEEIHTLSSLSIYYTPRRVLR